MIEDFAQLFKTPIVHVGESELDVAQGRYFEFKTIDRQTSDGKSAQIIQSGVDRESIFLKVLIGKKRLSVAGRAMLSEKLQTVSLLFSKIPTCFLSDVFIVF